MTPPPDEERAHVRRLIDAAKEEISPAEHQHDPGPCPICGGIKGRNVVRAQGDPR